ncbi:MAG TPA: hypothetical protein ENK38_04135 [Gammaproteobacteria bacterium]|nr:hypothetical protein [Gammaproteobacteria bacterium]
MTKTANAIFSTCLAIVILSFFAYSPSGGAAEKTDIYSGYYSRDGNDDRPAKISGNSIYIKFYPDQWVIMLYVPYPYSTSLKNEVLHNVFREVKKQAKSKAYIKGKFGFLAKKAIAHIETYEMKEPNKAVFECDGTAPCRVIFSNGYMEMRKAGIVSDHIIKFNRINE